MTTTLLPARTQCIVNLIGPTCCGKGYSGTLTAEHFRKHNLTVMVIDMGKLIRHRLDTEPEFHARWDSLVARGDLLPDSETLPTFHADLDKKRDQSDLLLIDGYFRSTAQVTDGARLGLLGPRATTLTVDISESTCLARHIHRCEKMAKEGKPRPDAKAFPRRIEVYNTTINEIMRVMPFMSSPAHTIASIDGDQPIETSMAPDMIRHTEVLMRRVTTHTLGHLSGLAGSLQLPIRATA
jgi:adenylate kinase family enzyme